MDQTEEKLVRPRRERGEPAFLTKFPWFEEWGWGELNLVENSVDRKTGGIHPRIKSKERTR